MGRKSEGKVKIAVSKKSEVKNQNKKEEEEEEKRGFL